jgi:hypothetical protein
MGKGLHKMTRAITVTAFSLISLLVAVVGYKYARSQIAADVYRDRLQSLVHDYSALRSDYNEAVKKTAVTELLVQDGSLCVSVRTADGKEEVINTPYDPKSEIYVDYVIVDGRLFIRRVFDEKTPPEKAKVIDPKLANIDWHAQGLKHGKAVYRSLEEGRWVVTVTGDGSLGIEKREGEDKIELTPAPPVRDYPQIEKEVDDKISEIGVGDVLGRLVGSQKKQESK